MATSRLMDQDVTNFTCRELSKYINDMRKTTFTSLSEAIAGLGLSAVSSILIPEMALTIASALSVGIAIATVIETVENGMDAAKLDKVLNQVADNGSVEVTTNFYEWLSGSGNHTGYYTKVTYRAI